MFRLELPHLPHEPIDKVIYAPLQLDGLLGKSDGSHCLLDNIIEEYHVVILVSQPTIAASLSTS